MSEPTQIYNSVHSCKCCDSPQKRRVDSRVGEIEAIAKRLIHSSGWKGDQANLYLCAWMRLTDAMVAEWAKLSCASSSLKHKNISNLGSTSFSRSELNWWCRLACRFFGNIFSPIGGRMDYRLFRRNWQACRIVDEPLGTLTVANTSPIKIVSYTRISVQCYFGV